MKYQKIYIIGPVGSGKTTLATKIAKKYNIKYYNAKKQFRQVFQGGL